MRLVHCIEAKHSHAILDIFNEAILNSTALWDYKPRPLQAMVDWFAIKRRYGFPVIGMEDEDGQLKAFASYGNFRSWPAYKYTVEHAIYVHRDYRGQGLGRRLLEHLVLEASERQVHVMIGGIEASNVASISLHCQLGFEHAGTLRHAGYKFGRWLDLALYERILDTPINPVED